MNKSSRSFIIWLQLVILGVCAAGAQDSKIDRREFLDYLETSRQLTKSTSFRNLTTIQTSDYPDRSWKPYSSWIVESVFPDRSYLSYKTGRRGDFVRIGKYLYSKEQHSSPWVRTEDDGQKWASIPSHPASIPGFKGPLVEFSISEKGETGTVVRVVSKPTSTAESKDTLTYIYSFDTQGALHSIESIGYNGRNFVRRIENYEYDPNIRIEAPIPS